MNMKDALALAACWLAGTAVASDMEIRWHLGDGSTEIEHREMEERDGVSVFALARSEIVVRKASSVELTPDFARAKKGDRGFWVVSSVIVNYNGRPVVVDGVEVPAEGWRLVK